MAAKDRVTTTLRIPRGIYEDAKRCAEDVFQSFNSYAIMAIAQRNRNWEDPSTGARLHERKAKDPWKGWICRHDSHAPMSAQECADRESESHQAQMEYVVDEVEGPFIFGWRERDELEKEVERRRNVDSETGEILDENEEKGENNA